MSRPPTNRRGLHAALACVVAVLLPAGARGAQATLSWSPDTDPTLQGYLVHYDRDPGAPYAGTDAAEGASPIVVPLAALPDPAHPSFTLTGLDSCVTYYFAIQASYAAGESGLSPEAAAVLVAAPTSVSVTASAPRTLRVAWSGPPADDSGTIPTYRLHYDVDSGQPYGGTGAAEGASPVEVPVAALFDPAHPSRDLTQLQPGQTYYVVVESVCGNGSAKPSDEASGTTAGPQDAGPAPDDGGDGDAGPAADGAGGVDGGEVRIDATSCGCGAAGRGGGVGWLVALLLLVRQRASWAMAGRRN